MHGLARGTAPTAPLARARPLADPHIGLDTPPMQILPSGEEIKLQRNALSVIELGPEQTEVRRRAALAHPAAIASGQAWSLRMPRHSPPAPQESSDEEEEQDAREPSRIGEARPPRPLAVDHTLGMGPHRWAAAAAAAG